MNIPYDELQVITENQPYPLLFVSISGAHLYGFPSPDSDYDLRGSHILPLEEIAGLLDRNETIEASRQEGDIELDLVTYDVEKYCRLLLQRNGNVLEQVYSPLIVETTSEHHELQKIVRGCITKHHAHHYLGLAKNQWKLFNKEQQVKKLLYVYRVLLTGIHLMRTGYVNPNVVELNETFSLPHVAELVHMKMSGEEKAIFAGADVVFHEAEYERLVGELEEARDSSHLPEVPTAYDELNDWLLRVRLG